jgi:hypothetical protein
VAVLVVQAAPVRVGEHLVRLGDGAKAVLRVGVLVHVRVQLAREPAEGLLDLGLGRAALDAEQVVVIAFGRRHAN